MQFWCSFISFLLVNYVACALVFKHFVKAGFVLRFILSLVVTYLFGFFVWIICGYWFLIPVPLNVSDMFLTLTVCGSPIFCIIYVLVKRTRNPSA